MAWPQPPRETGDQYDTPGPDRRHVLVAVGVAALLLAGGITIAAVWTSSVYGAVVPFGIIAVVMGLQAVLYALPAAKVRAEAAARSGQGNCPADDGFDPPSRALLRRVHDAIGAVTSSEVCRAGLLDRAAVTTALAGQESEITAALHDQARMRAKRAERTPSSAGPMTTAVSASQIEAAQRAESSIAARVEALERYAAEVAVADAAYRDRRQAARLAELHSQHLDMLARTAADEHGIAEIETMSQQVSAVTLALSEHGTPAPPGNQEALLQWLAPDSPRLAARQQPADDDRDQRHADTDQQQVGDRDTA